MHCTWFAQDVFEILLRNSQTDRCNQLSLYINVHPLLRFRRDIPISRWKKTISSSEPKEFAERLSVRSNQRECQSSPGRGKIFRFARDKFSNTNAEVIIVFRFCFCREKLMHCIYSNVTHEIQRRCVYTYISPASLEKFKSVQKFLENRSKWTTRRFTILPSISSTI